MRQVSHLIMISTCVMFLLSYNFMLGAGSLQEFSSPPLKLFVSPSATTIKVGDEAEINLTVTSKPTSGTVCFSEQGFPFSGFTLTFTPQCAPLPRGAARAQLIVEATPAAAPQNFTALILATLGNKTASAPLTITVVPAIPPWIPWLGILVFVLVIGTALFMKPRSPKSKGKMNDV